MENARQGVSSREIARMWDVSSPYVTKLLRRMGIGPLPGGGYDLEEATRLRKKFTNVGRGKRKWLRRHPDGYPTAATALTCEACGARYRLETSARTGTPHPQKFCCTDCEQDLLDGLSDKQIRRRRDRGKINNHAVRPPSMPAKPPEPVRRDLRQCLACGGTFDALQGEFYRGRLPKDSRFCDWDCEADFGVGVDRASTQQRIRMACSEGMFTEEDLRTKSYLDYA